MYFILSDNNLHHHNYCPEKKDYFIPANDGCFRYWSQSPKLLPLPLHDKLLVLWLADHKYTGPHLTQQIKTNQPSSLSTLDMDRNYIWHLKVKIYFRESWCNRKLWSAILWMLPSGSSVITPPPLKGRYYLVVLASWLLSYPAKWSFSFLLGHLHFSFPKSREHRNSAVMNL